MLILLAQTYFTQNPFQGAKFFLYPHVSKSDILEANASCQSVESFGSTSMQMTAKYDLLTSENYS